MTKSSEGLKSTADVAKQVIALATGVITVTVAFFDKIQGDTPSSLVHWLIVGSWVALLASIGLALYTLLGVTTALNKLDRIENGETPWPPPNPAGAPDKPAKLPSAYDPLVRGPAALMMVFFLSALLLTAAAGVFRAPWGSPTPSPAVAAR